MLFVRILCKNTSTPVGFLVGFLFCLDDGVEEDHLLIHCEGAHWLWSVVFRSFSVSWVYQMRAVVFLDRETFVSLEPLYVSWIIWRELILEHSGTWRVGPAYSLVFRHLV